MTIAVPIRRPVEDFGEWEDMLASACNAITGTSSDMMTSITVSGRLRGTQGEARQVLMIGQQLAADRGLKVGFEIDRHILIVRFTRRNDASI